jgi:hypothetical protein
MICPHCSASIRYRERSNQVCSKCYKAFAFEPKTHPLRISDNYFQSVVNKLNDNGKFYFTPQQLQFAVSRKAIKSTGWLTALSVFAVITTLLSIGFSFALFKEIFSKSSQTVIFALCALAVAAVILFWVIVILVFKKLYKPFVTLPQSHIEFENGVLADWRRIYKKQPDKLAIKFPFQENFRNSKAILLCQTDDAAMCLTANKINDELGIGIVFQLPKIADILQRYGKMPVYVLHDASIEGVAFFENAKQQIGQQGIVFDIGLRPQIMLKSNYPKMREKGANTNFRNGLTAEEKDWLNQGYSVPLYVLRPEKLIQHVRKHIEKRGKMIEQTTERRAKSIGFMTWVRQ